MTDNGCKYFYKNLCSKNYKSKDCTNCFRDIRNDFFDRIDETEVQDFLDFLMGKYMPQNLYMKNPPKLTANMAFKIIYYMQEILGVLPDKFEMCKTCKQIYDSENGGSLKDRHCDYCRRN